MRGRFRNRRSTSRKKRRAAQYAPQIIIPATSKCSTGLEAGHIMVTVQATDAQAPTARRILEEEGSTRTSGSMGASGASLSTPTTPTL